jgi:hypothetical protein
MGVCILNYLDDLAGVEKPEHAEFCYSTLTKVLELFCFREASEKCCPPSTIMNFLGILFNTDKMTMEITPERLVEICKLVNSWLKKKEASQQQVSSAVWQL